MSDDVYLHKDAPLTPGIFERLIVELFSGRVVRRREIIAQVPSFHAARGGAPADAQSLTSSAKKALLRLSRKGIVENIGHGVWRVHPAIAKDVDSDSPTDEMSVLEQDVQAVGQALDGVEKSFGEGDGAIYVYYLPSYERLAQAEGRMIWPCKVGRTGGDPLERVLSQAATALPERPTVAIVLQTPLPQVWENALHSILTIRGRHIAGVPGTEWFMTSPDELLAIAFAIDPSLDPASEGRQN